jgi:hypothetical protein
MTINVSEKSDGDLQEQGEKLGWLTQRVSKRNVIYLTGLLDVESIKALEGQQIISILPTHVVNDKGEIRWVMKARPAPPRNDLAEEQAKSGFGQPIAKQMASANAYAAAKAKRESQAPLAEPQQAAATPPQPTTAHDIPF